MKDRLKAFLRYQIGIERDKYVKSTGRPSQPAKEELLAYMEYTFKRQAYEKVLAEFVGE